MTREALETIKATPSITVGTMTFIGVPLSDWVLILTSIYTAMQIIFLVRDRLIKRRNKKDPK
jgi:hypothetical protein